MAKIQKLRQGQEITPEWLNQLVAAVEAVEANHKFSEEKEKEISTTIDQLNTVILNMEDKFDKKLLDLPELPEVLAALVETRKDRIKWEDLTTDPSTPMVSSNTKFIITRDYNNLDLNGLESPTLIFDIQMRCLIIYYNGELINLTTDGEGEQLESITKYVPRLVLVEEEGEYYWYACTKESSTPIQTNIVARGPKGDTGEKGETGPEGPRGYKGDQGPQGDQGPAGANGRSLQYKIVSASSPDGLDIVDGWDKWKQWLGIIFYHEGDSVSDINKIKPIWIQKRTTIYYPSIEDGKLRFTTNINEAVGIDNYVSVVGPQGPQGPKGEKGDGGDLVTLNLDNILHVDTISDRPEASREYLNTGIFVGNILYVCKPDASESSYYKWVSLGQVQGPKGDRGEPGTTPHIDIEGGHWWIGNTDTGIKAQGEPGNGVEIIVDPSGYDYPKEDASNFELRTLYLTGEKIYCCLDNEVGQKEWKLAAGTKGDKGDVGPAGKDGTKYCIVDYTFNPMQPNTVRNVWNIATNYATPKNGDTLVNKSEGYSAFFDGIDWVEGYDPRKKLSSTKTELETSLKQYVDDNYATKVSVQEVLSYKIKNAVVKNKYITTANTVQIATPNSGGSNWANAPADLATISYTKIGKTSTLVCKIHFSGSFKQGFIRFNLLNVTEMLGNEYKLTSGKFSILSRSATGTINNGYNYPDQQLFNNNFPGNNSYEAVFECDTENDAAYKYITMTCTLLED